MIRHITFNGIKVKTDKTHVFIVNRIKAQEQGPQGGIPGRRRRQNNRMKQLFIPLHIVLHPINFVF
jgi:hypothetical protein